MTKKARLTNTANGSFLAASHYHNFAHCGSAILSVHYSSNSTFHRSIFILASAEMFLLLRCSALRDDDKTSAILRKPLGSWRSVRKLGRSMWERELAPQQNISTCCSSGCKTDLWRIWKKIRFATGDGRGEKTRQKGMDGLCLSHQKNFGSASVVLRELLKNEPPKRFPLIFFMPLFSCFYFFLFSLI